MEKSNNKILVAAGGTGGHLFPAMAVVEQLRYLTNNRIEPIFVGNPEKIESRKVPEAGFEFVPLSIKGYQGLFKLSTFKLPFQLIDSVNICKKIISDNNIKLVLCAGAYLSYPAGLAAISKGIPLILMESNLNLGKANKKLANKANLIITAFDESKEFIDNNLHNKVHCFGNPVRNFLYSFKSKLDARRELGLAPNKKTVFVFGGSLGSKSINWALEQDIYAFEEDEIQFIWQLGNNYELQNDPPSNVKLFKFIDDMETAYSASDLVVSRSGATTVAELALTAKPSILIPLPSASNNEQEYNAKYFEKKGAAIVMKDSEISGNLGRMINDVIQNDELLKRMSEQANKLAKPNAAIDSARAILNLFIYQ